MADRYDDYERNYQGRRGEGREGREGRERGEFGRDESDYRNRGRGGWEDEQERQGRGEWGRERQNEQYYGGPRGEYGGQRGEYGSQRGEYGGQRGDYGQRGDDRGQRFDYGHRYLGVQHGEFGRGESGGQRGDQGQWSGERDWQPRGPEWQRSRLQPMRERTGHEGPWGTGSQGFGTGYRSGDFSSSYSGAGSYTGFGSSGMESYSGGSGTYGQQQRGRFSGRGPKGYQRGDERIREDVCERLTHHPDIDASEVEVKVTNAEVTLTGTVDERQAKRMSEEVAENVSGVREVHNQLRVRDRDRETAGTQHQGGSTAGKGTNR